MIPNITRGGDMRGLMRYLVTTQSRDDPRANQHEHPRVIAGDPFLTNVYTEELTADNGRAIADYLDRPRVLYGVEVTSRRWAQEAGTGQRVAVLDKDGGQAVTEHHVWHCSLSLADDEHRTDEQWQRIAQGFMDRLEFTEASGKAPCRWVAVHHGAGKSGHDHVHLVASVARQDGTRWAVWPDFKRAQDACRDLEREHNLKQVGREFAMPGLNPAEKRLEERVGDIRQDIAARVRSAAVASSSEAEWIRRVRDAGVTLKPRFAPGTTDVVIGYRAGVNLAPEGKAEWRFYAGGSLGRDLSLPRVRECWPEPTLDQAQAASDEWQRAYRVRQPAAGTTGQPPDARAAIEALRGYEARLRAVPLGDRRAWASAARDVSGALSAWARVDPDHAPALRRAAQVVARSAQDRGRGVRPRPMASLAPALAFLATEKPSNLHKAALAAALVDLAEALVQWHTVTSRLAEAHRLTAARARLEDTRDRMMSGTPGVEKAIANVQRIRAAWGTPTRGPSPLPNVLQPPAPTPKVQRGTERDYGR